MSVCGLSRLPSRTVFGALVLPWMVAACSQNLTDREPIMGPGVIELKLADQPGGCPVLFRDLRRAPVDYDHIKHVEALGEDQCQTCHRLDSKERVVPLFMRLSAGKDRADLMDLYHVECMGCHARRDAEGSATGSLTCGQCHEIAPAAGSAWREIDFDYSLHYRHVRAADDKCQACHHVYDEKSEELVYREGEENACGDCHGDCADGETPSLRDAAHMDCIACHLQRAREDVKGGPFLCTGCHDADKQKVYDKIIDVPRLRRGQPDVSWISTRGAKARMVSFNHVFHERMTSACSDCHHQTLRACSECHELGRIGTDGAVSLEEAYHDATSDHSCVGCHAKETSRKACSGCHFFMPRPPVEASCAKCHAGPPASTEPPLPEAIATRTEFDPLPAAGEDFPEQITIDKLADEYEPALFPHRKIALALDEKIRRSDLARMFHSYPETLCTGCHHNTPVDARPAACDSCHDDQGLDDRDKPDIFTAYHRQCIGCHQRMGLEQQGCTDCHAEVSREGLR